MIDMIINESFDYFNFGFMHKHVYIFCYIVLLPMYLISLKMLTLVVTGKHLFKCLHFFTSFLEVLTGERG